MSHRKENGDGERIGLGEKKKIKKMNVERGEDGRKPKEKLAPSESGKKRLFIYILMHAWSKFR